MSLASLGYRNPAVTSHCMCGLNAGLCLALLVAGSGAAVAADPTAGLEKQVDALVASSQKRLDQVRDELVKNIKQVQNNIRKSDFAPDAKRLMLQRVQSDLDRLETTQELPTCDELREESIDAAVEYQKVLKQVEDKRQSLLDKALNTQDPAVQKKLMDLEQRISGLFGGRIEFVQGDNWQGTREGPDGRAFTLKLHLSEVAGGVFRGELTQIDSNHVADIMKVEGRRDGYAFTMRTTGMLRGAGRSLRFDGCVIGRLIVADLGGTAVGGRAASGRISLSKN